jgi:exonuclease SbcD
MRLIHTSDWHLGQTLHFYDRAYEHQVFLDWLLDVLEVQQADALLISGDVFDVANPSAASQKQFYRFLTDTRKRIPHLSIVVIAGNHDSPVRLEAPTPFLEILDTVVVGQVPRKPDGNVDAEHMVVPLTTATGDVWAWCLAVPFLRPGDVPRVETEGDAYLEGVAALYQEALNIARSRTTNGQAIIAMGHCFLPGMKTSSDSERPLVIGGAEALPEKTFESALSYVALGHLHLAQHPKNRPHIRYSGSPIPLSFSEVGYEHQVLRIDFDQNELKEVQKITVPRPVEFLRYPKEPLPLEEVLLALEQLELPDLPEERQPYLEVPVLMDGPQIDRRRRIDEALEGKPVRFARVDPTSPVRVAGSSQMLQVSLDSLRELKPETVFRNLYERKHGEAPPAPVLSAFLELAVDALGNEE